jgi:hypothetical protein
MSTPSPVRSLTDSRTAELDRQHGSWWYMLSASRPIDGLLFWVGFLALFRGFSKIMLAFSMRHAREEAAAIDPGSPR